MVEVAKDTTIEVVQALVVEIVVPEDDEEEPTGMETTTGQHAKSMGVLDTLLKGVITDLIEIIKALHLVTLTTIQAIQALKDRLISLIKDLTHVRLTEITTATIHKQIIIKLQPILHLRSQLLTLLGMPIAELRAMSLLI